MGKIERLRKLKEHRALRSGQGALAALTGAARRQVAPRRRPLSAGTLSGSLCRNVPDRRRLLRQTR